MFNPENWARAFVNSLGKDGDLGDGIDSLKAFAAWVKSLPDTVSGAGDAETIEALIREGAGQADILTPARETALRFFILMIKKHRIRYMDAVIERIQMIRDRQNGVLQVVIEYAEPPEESFKARIEKDLAQQTGAARIVLTEKTNPALIGGYKMKIGDEVMDASIRFQLGELEACLAGDMTRSGDGGN